MEYGTIIFNEIRHKSLTKWITKSIKKSFTKSVTKYVTITATKYVAISDKIFEKKNGQQIFHKICLRFSQTNITVCMTIFV